MRVEPTSRSLFAALAQAGPPLAASFKADAGDAIIQGDPTVRLRRRVAPFERRLRAAFADAVESQRLPAMAVAEAAEQLSPSRTLLDAAESWAEGFSGAFLGLAWEAGEPVADQTAEAVERWANRKRVLFDSEPSKEALRLAYLGRSRELVKQLTAEQRKAVYRLLQRAAQDQIPTRELARLLRAVVGLTTQDAARLERLAAALIEKRYEAGRMARALDRFRGQLVRARSLRIARTEMSWAHNQAQLETMKGVAEQLRMDVWKQWFAAADELTCPICAELNGQTQPLTGMFQAADIQVDAPGAHVNCRCAMIYVTEAPKPAGVA